MIDTLIYPTDNQYGIPALLPECQPPTLIAPIIAWGSISRLAIMPGTYHFYVDDYRFNALLKNPERLVNTQAVAAIEPNISIPPSLPLALALERLYRKRWVARHWQQAGIMVWVDLHISPEFRPYALLGVPRGWLAYATRGYNANLSEIEQEYTLASHHAGQRPLFLVYGGGSIIQSAALSNGWLWVPEQRSLLNEYEIPAQAGTSARAH